MLYLLKIWLIGLPVAFGVYYKLNLCQPSLRMMSIYKWISLSIMVVGWPIIFLYAGGLFVTKLICSIIKNSQ